MVSAGNGISEMGVTAESNETNTGLVCHLGAFHKLRLQLGWVGSQQNANLCKLRVRRSFWKCLRLQKILNLKLDTYSILLFVVEHYFSKDYYMKQLKIWEKKTCQITSVFIERLHIARKVLRSFCEKTVSCMFLYPNNFFKLEF